MKLLLDENLSDRIVAQILDLYPGSTHVKAAGLIHTDDALIWSFAQEENYTIVSKDADFHQRSLVFGHPPKLVYLYFHRPKPDVVRLHLVRDELLTC